MASANSTFTEIVTTTLREHPNEVTDNVSLHNALYRRLKDKNQIRKIDGGYEIVRPLDYAENSTYQRYSGLDTLDIEQSNVLSAAKYDWVQAAVNVISSGRELRANSGKNQIIELAVARIKNAMRTAANNMSVDLYSDGALTNQMGGLANILQTGGTGTVGGINSSTYTFWKCKATSWSAPTKSNVKTYMNPMWISLNRGNDKPDLIVCTNDYFGYYWESLQDLQRYVDDTKAVAGFQSLKYVTADVIFDSNTNYTATGQKMFFLNTDYLEMVVHRDANWSQLDDKVSVNQDGVVIPIIWMGNLTVSNRSLQGMLYT